MLAAARDRVKDLSNVELRPGTLEALPIESSSLDAATLMLVLHHLAAPADALAEARRVLKPGGRLLIVDMAPHEHEEYRQRMGHVWLGFSAEQMQRMLTQAGFERIHIHALPPGAEAKGPALFAASATKTRGLAPIGVSRA
jgi:ArsR family transcriptional regulator